MSNERNRLLVIGVGNPYRNDDAVGLVVARRIRDLNLQGVTVIEANGEGASLMEAWQGADSVILIDAGQRAADGMARPNDHGCSADGRAARYNPTR